MNEKPILFNGKMVRAILDGTKTQTRRVMKFDHHAHVDLLINQLGPEWTKSHAGKHGCPRSPYGYKGDRLWVRETFARKNDLGRETILYKASLSEEDRIPDWVKWKPSIFMPRSASRINLVVLSVRAQKLQDITEAEALAEGVGPREFPDLWDSINLKRGYGYNSNPWVWAVTFEKSGIPSNF